MDSLTHNAYLERRELAWCMAGVVPDGALDAPSGTIPALPHARQGAGQHDQRSIEHTAWGGQYRGGSTGVQRRAASHPLRAADPQRAASSEGREREGQRGGREGWRQEWGWYGRAAEREEGRVQQHRVSGMGRGQQGEGRRRRGSGMARINTRATTYFLRRLSRRHRLISAASRYYRLISDATAVHSITYLGHVVGAQSFFGYGFFDAGATQRGSRMLHWNSMHRGVGKRRLCMGCACAWYVEHGFCIPSRTRESDPRARLEMSNGRVRLELSDAGSRFRVGNTTRWNQTSTG